jgi:two-component system sporulation sensor kinase C
VITLLQSSESKGEHVTISTKLEGSLNISGDSRQLQQVFWNLGLNAVDAVSDGGNVHIYTRNSNKRAEVCFRDSGQGIIESDVDKIFYPFFTTKEKGTGLGLSIAQKIVEEHGGKIVVESGEGTKGTTFKVILPVSNV